MSTLDGQKIIVTRSLDDFETTAQAIRQRGGIPLACPLIQFTPPCDPAPLHEAIRSLEHYDWIFFTSAHSVQFFFQALEEVSQDQIDLSSIQAAAIGPQTEHALLRYGIKAAFTAKQSTADSFFHAFQQTYLVQDQRFLLPLSNLAKETLKNLLLNEGGKVTVVTAYQNEPIREFPKEILDHFNKNKVDWVMFFSPSAVKNFYQLYQEMPSTKCPFSVASIGPTTSQALNEMDVKPTVEASTHTLEGLLTAMSQA